MVWVMTACAGPQKTITAPLRNITLSPPPAIVIKDLYFFAYETVRCADTNQFLVTDRPFSVIPPEKALKIDLKIFTPKASQPELIKSLSVFFSVNSFSLDTHETQKLARFINQLKQNQIGPVEVTGYTCRMGSKEYNQKLAVKRAMTVADSLKRQGIPIASVTGKAGCCYISDSDPAQNRRVEITVSQAAKQSVAENQEGGDPEIKP